jgi:hypothetical protein
VVLFWTHEGGLTDGDWGFTRIAIGGGLIAALIAIGLSLQGG